MLGNPQVGSWSGLLSPLLHFPVLFVFVFLFHVLLSPSHFVFKASSLVGAFARMLMVFNLDNLKHSGTQCVWLCVYLCECGCCHESHVALLSASACLLYVQRLWSSVAPPGL